MLRISRAFLVSVADLLRDFTIESVRRLRLGDASAMPYFDQESFEEIDRRFSNFDLLLGRWTWAQKVE